MGEPPPWHYPPIISSQGRPTFAWSSDGLTVREAISASAAGSQPQLSRAVRVRGNAEGLVVLRAARGATIDDIGDGWWRVDDRWNVRLSGEALTRPAVHSVDGAMELRATVRHRRGSESLFLEEISWDTPGSN